MISEYYKRPRLYLNAPMDKNAVLSLSPPQAHYLKNVLRQDAGQMVRVFNGADGEWLARINDLSRKGGAAHVTEQIRPQAMTGRTVHLYFAPIKKQRLDILIEKAVELGVSHLHPVLTSRAEMRTLNTERLEAQIIEAAEQNERLTIPSLSPVCSLSAALSAAHAYPLYACLERGHSTPLHDVPMPQALGFLIGPSGGFDQQEIEIISQAKGVTPVSLGDHILRAETAVLACLSYALLSK